MNKKKQDIPFAEIPHVPLMPQVWGIQGSSGAQGITAIPTQLPAGTISWNLTLTWALAANNLSWTNTGDETATTLAAKQWVLMWTKIYYVSDTLNGANDRKLTFINWVLTSEI